MHKVVTLSRELGEFNPRSLLVVHEPNGSALGETEVSNKFLGDSLQLKWTFCLYF